MTPTSFLMWGIVGHLIADWLFQNHWMATNKQCLTHPAAWAHGLAHLLFMAYIFPEPLAFLIVASHMLLDTRRPLAWWRRVYGQTTTGDMAVHVATWTDQVAHIAVIAVAALLAGL